MKIYRITLLILLIMFTGNRLSAQNIIRTEMSEIQRGRDALNMYPNKKIPGFNNNNASARQSVGVSNPKTWWNNQTPAQPFANCSVDTVEYITYKGWIAENLPPGLYDSAYAINIGQNSIISCGQWFPAPDSIAIAGFRFVSYLPQTAGNFVLPVTCNLYAAGPDSMPLGNPIKTILVNVDTSVVWRYASFIIPISTVYAGNGFVISVENNNITPAQTFCTDNSMTVRRCGYREWLACGQFTQFTNPWQQSYNFNSGGQVFDADFIFHPIVTFNINAAASSSVNCFGSTTVNFTNTSSPMFGSRFYNFNAFLAHIGGPVINQPHVITPWPPLTANSFGDSTYVWNYGDSSPNDTMPSTVHTFPGANPYNVTMTGRLARWRSSTATCTDTWINPIGPIPNATITVTGSTSFCMGNYVLLNCPNPANSYQWYRNGTAIPGEVNDTLIATLGGTYTLKLTNSSVCFDSTATGVTVTLLPGATASISVTGATTFCNGGSAQLTASGGSTQQWYLNGNLIPGATTANYTAVTGGSYTVMVFNPSGCPDSTIVPTIINVQAASISVGGPSAVCVGPVIMTASAGVSYQWFENGILLPGVTTQQYTTNTNDSYTVAVEFASGCIDTTSTPTVVTIGPMNANVNTSGPVTFCGGGNVVLTAVTQGAGTYQWYDNNVPLPGQTTGILNVNSSGLYTVVVSSPGPVCTDSTAVGVTVTVNPAPNPAVIASGSLTICPGGSVTFTASGGFTFQWTHEGIPIPGANGAIYTALGTSPGNYNVIVSNGPCSDTLNAPLLVISQPLVASTVQSGIYTICSNAPLLIQALPTGSQTYTWYRNGSQIASGPFSTLSAGQPGDYTVKITDPGCSDSTTTPITLNVNPAPNAVITASGPLQFCSGDSITLNTSGGITYQWYRNNVVIPGATTTNIKVNNSGLYTVRVVNGIGCPDSSAAANVVVSPSPAASLSVTGPLNFCTGNNVLLTAPGTIQTGYNYTWLRNGNVINGATAPSYSANTSGTYTVVVTLGICLDTLLVGAVVQVDSLPPLAGFTPTLNNSQVTMTNTSLRARTYLWNMGDGNTYNTVNATHTYAQGGIYTITLYAYNACGVDSFQLQVLTARDELSGIFSGLEIFPNPGNGMFHLKMDISQGAELEYKVNDLKGRTLIEGKDFAPAGSYTRTFDLNDAATGVYILSLKSGSSLVHRKLIIK